MNQLPIFIQVRDWGCLVGGGGEIAARKISLLLRVDTQVVVVAPKLCANLAALHEEGKITWEKAEFDPRHLAHGAFGDHRQPHIRSLTDRRPAIA